MAIDIGSKIGQYVIIEKIGEAGMGIVWSARQERLNRIVAVKTIRPLLSEDINPVELFKREAQTIANLEHQHILPIYDFGEIESQLYIVMRYMAGGDMDSVMNRGPMPVNEVLRLGQAIASALDYAHAQKVIHLDLKPPNILMDSNQTPYLADFGLATKLNPQGKANNPGAGTLLYMAPEQLTAEMIDHRTDIYSFTILLFHMLTGQLPFEAMTPLALKQLQFQEDLPPVESYSEELPPALNEILRHGTAVDPESRPETIESIIDAIRTVVAPAAMIETVESWRTLAGEKDGLAPDEYFDEADPMPIEDLELLEAVDIYSRARHAWAGGNGRFLLGVTHYLIITGFYKDAALHQLELDTSGIQMLLRGALEYDIDVDYWWSRVNDESRRWVCLHAIRSGNAPARVRALYRLETLPDADQPQIPRLVAQALQIENNQEARLAALQVLSTRAKLMKRPDNYDIQTEYRGRMLTTITRLGIQLSAPGDWLEVVYSPEIDELIAETALDNSMPRVAEFAARVVGRIRSTAAVRTIAEAQSRGQSGALRALALIRDETPSLPPVVSNSARGYAWISNSFRRMFERPMSIVWRYLFALIGGWLAMGFHVYMVFRTQAIFAQQRWANTVAIGLIFGILFALVPMFGDEFSSRLRKFWHPWLRFLAGISIATFWGLAAWWSFGWFYLNFQPSFNEIFIGGFGMALGFSLRALFNLRSWFAIPLTALLMYIPIYITFFPGALFQPVGPFEYGEGFFQFDQALLYYAFEYGDDNLPITPDQLFNVAIPFVLVATIGAYLPLIWQDIRRLMGYETPEEVRISRKLEEQQLDAEAKPKPNLDTIPFPQDQQGAPVNYNTQPLSEMDSQAVIERQDSSLLNMQTITDVDVDAYSTRTLSSGDEAQRMDTLEIKQDANMHTEVDHEQGYLDDVPDDAADVDDDESPDTQRVNIGTGIKINLNPGDMNTEFDTDKGNRPAPDGEDDEGEKDK